MHLPVLGCLAGFADDDRHTIARLAEGQPDLDLVRVLRDPVFHARGIYPADSSVTLATIRPWHLPDTGSLWCVTPPHVRVAPPLHPDGPERVLAWSLPVDGPSCDGRLFRIPAGIPASNAEQQNRRLTADDRFILANRVPHKPIGT